MPYKKKTKASKKTDWRKRTKYESRKRSVRLVVPRYMTPFPPKYRIKLVYTGWIADGRAGNGTTSNTAYTFKLNSCYDPYGGSTGQYNIQSMYYDQVSQLYKRYCVSGAKVEIKYCPPTVEHAMTLIRPTTVSTTPTDFQLEESRPNSIKRTISTGGDGSYIKAYFDIAKIHGVSKSKLMNDDLYSALTTADPTLICYLHILNCNSANTTTDNPLSFNVKITQYITLYDRTIVSAS